MTKKFLKKHWGFPLLGEENDIKLLKTTLVIYLFAYNTNLILIFLASSSIKAFTRDYHHSLCLESVNVVSEYKL